jgi:hypothetical protein
LAVHILVLLCLGCAHNPACGSSPEIWLTYARNVPHATQQRANLFLPSEQMAAVVRGFPGQWVTVSVHELRTGRLLGQTIQYVSLHAGRAIFLKPLRPGEYVARASQEGVLKAEAQFGVRE